MTRDDTPDEDVLPAEPDEDTPDEDVLPGEPDDDPSDEDPREAEPEEIGDDEGGDPRDRARDAAARQAGAEGEPREGSRTATGHPGNAGADR